MGCGPDRIEVAPGITRPVAHDLGNLRVCSEDPDGSRGYYDPVAFNVNLKYGLEKIGPQGLAAALAGSSQSLLSSAQGGGAAAPAQVESALRFAAGSGAITGQSAYDVLGIQAPNFGGSPVASFTPSSISPYDFASSFNGPSYSELGFLPGAGGVQPSFGGTLGYSTDGGFNSSFGLINPNSAGGNGTSSDPLGGYGGLLALGLGGAGLLASLFGGNDSKTTSQTNLPPMSAAELQLLGINTSLAMGQLAAYNTQLGQQGQQNSLIGKLFEQELGGYGPTQEQQAQYGSACDQQYGAGSYNGKICNEMYRQQITKNNEAARTEQVQKDEQLRIQRGNEAAQQSGQVGQQAFTDALQGSQQLRPDQLERIRGAADLSIQSGLSDIGNFRDAGLNAIRLNSASRGLRPNDTPIQNDFHDLATDAQRTATNFTNNIRSQQLNTELTLPFEESKLRQSNLGLSGDLALRRQALEESLRQNAQQSRIGLATGSQATGLGLATGLNPASAFGALTSARTAGGSTTQTQQGSALSSIGPVLGGLGGLLQGYGSLYGNGNRQQGY